MYSYAYGNVENRNTVNIPSVCRAEWDNNNVSGIGVSFQTFNSLHPRDHALQIISKPKTFVNMSHHLNSGACHCSGHFHDSDFSPSQFLQQHVEEVRKTSQHSKQWKDPQASSSIQNLEPRSQVGLATLSCISLQNTSSASTGGLSARQKAELYEQLYTQPPRTVSGVQETSRTLDSLHKQIFSLKLDLYFAREEREKWRRHFNEAIRWIVVLQCPCCGKGIQDSGEQASLDEQGSHLGCIDTDIPAGLPPSRGLVRPDDISGEIVTYSPCPFLGPSSTDTRTRQQVPHAPNPTDTPVSHSSTPRSSTDFWLDESCRQDANTDSIASPEPQQVPKPQSDNRLQRYPPHLRRPHRITSLFRCSASARPSLPTADMPVPPASTPHAQQASHPPLSRHFSQHDRPGHSRSRAKGSATSPTLRGKQQYGATGEVEDYGDEDAGVRVLGDCQDRKNDGDDGYTKWRWRWLRMWKRRV
jgi:hypothetical protein